MTVKPVIHVGIDSSWRDTGALEWALQESLVRHEPLQVVHVVDEQKRRVPGWEHSVDESSMDLVTEVQRYLDEIPGTLDNEADLVVGPPPQTLTELAVHSRMLVAAATSPVVIALDDSDEQSALIEFGIAEARERRLAVRLVHVVDGVVSAAAEADAQLLVVGTRHHTRVASVLLGSVTRGVLHHAACPLAVVPPAVVL